MSVSHKSTSCKAVHDLKLYVGIKIIIFQCQETTINWNYQKKKYIYFWYYFTLLVALTVHISRWQTEEETEFVDTKGNYNINLQCITDHYKSFILNQSGAFWITFFCLVIDGDNNGLSFLKSSKSWVFMNSINTDTSGTLKLVFTFFFVKNAGPV